jgi:tetratricopeptide (TPR) repeat protein
VVSAIGDDLKKVCTSARIFFRRAWAQRTTHAVRVTLCLSVCAAFTSRAEGQTPLQAVERLYSSAAYEDALAALDTVDVASDGERIESAEYRILCLLGMGERERAEAAIEELVTSHPHYRPSPARFSPSRQEQFNRIRRQVLVRIFEASAEEARASFEAKDYDSAIPRFEALLELLKATGSDAQFDEVRAHAADYLQRAKAAALALEEDSKPKPVGPSGVAANGEGSEQVAAATAGLTSVYDVTSADVVPPVALKPILPPTPRDGSGVTPNPGLFEILVDESGRVQSASVRRSVSAQYDALVLSESATWRFRPATRKGQPVPFRKLVEIYAVPLASLQR